MSSNYYFTIFEKSIAEFKDRGSRFIACAFPINSIAEFKIQLAAIKKDFPKATHYCFAYRIGTDATIFRSSDAGEPSGSAGKPILGQIDSNELTDVAVVVIRFFGGSLLGVPGLINAYKTSTALALQTTAKIKKDILVYYNLEFDYTKMNEVMLVIKKFNCAILKNEATLFCKLQIGIPKSNLEISLLKFNEMNGLRIEKI